MSGSFMGRGNQHIGDGQDSALQTTRNQSASTNFPIYRPELELKTSEVVGECVL